MRESITLAPPAGITCDVLGLEVEEGAVPPLWDAPIRTERICADSDRARIEHGPVVLYVEAGRRVVIQAPDTATRLAYDYLAYASALRLVMWQQGRFNLHATLVIDPGERAVAVSGQSISGKSTTTVELLLRGWRFLCDDVVEVELRDGLPVAVPHGRPVHLADAAAEALGASPETGRPLPWRGKRVYSLVGDLQPRLLAALVHLIETDGPRVHTARPEDLAHLPLVVSHNDYAGICRLPELQQGYFGWAAALAERVPFFLVERPHDRHTVPEVADQVVAAVAGVHQTTRPRA